MIYDGTEQMTLTLRNESFVAIQPKLAQRQAQVLEVVKNSKIGATAWEISGMTGLMIHVVRPRLTELCDLGIIKESGSRWYEKTQRNETVWVEVVK